MLKEAVHFTLTQCSDDTSVLQHRSQHIINGESLRLVVPSGMRRRVLQHSHSTKWNGHVGPKAALTVSSARDLGLNNNLYYIGP
eukprot:9557-Heterococcus_DN1.PRE.1